MDRDDRKLNLICTVVQIFIIVLGTNKYGSENHDPASLIQ